MPSAIQTTQIDVLTAFETMVKTISGLGDANVWITDNPPASAEEIDASNRHKLFVVIVPLEGNPEGGKFIGGGANSLVEQTGVTTIIYSTDRLSRTGRQKHALTRSDIGLFKLKGTLLTTLHGQYLLDGSSNHLLTQPIECIHSERPTVGGQPIGDLALTWLTPFHWSL